MKRIYEVGVDCDGSQLPADARKFTTQNIALDYISQHEGFEDTSYTFSVNIEEIAEALSEKNPQTYYRAFCLDNQLAYKLHCEREGFPSNQHVIDHMKKTGFNEQEYKAKIAAMRARIHGTSPKGDDPDRR